MRPRKLRRVLITGASVAALTVTAFGYATQADADPALDYASLYAGAVCSTLDEYPSIAGVTGIGQAIHEDGLSFYDAGRAVGIAVAVECPRHQPLLDAFVATARSSQPGWVA